MSADPITCPSKKVGRGRQAAGRQDAFPSWEGGVHTHGWQPQVHNAMAVLMSALPSLLLEVEVPAGHAPAAGREVAVDLQRAHDVRNAEPIRVVDRLPDPDQVRGLQAVEVDVDLQLGL